MINIIKSMFYRLSYNPFMIKIAKKIFVYFPALKYKLIQLRDSGYTPRNSKSIYSNNLIKKIKADVLKAKKEELK